ncbi:hypothetical protein LCGC14_0208540 [marine sediment metagenome]|uniref:Recombination endonuclease VII n=1 Tax=marine sediment metagenome TaxID=412755 RepID=A0A0F9XJX9_9ZZZZ
MLKGSKCTKVHIAKVNKSKRERAGNRKCRRCKKVFYKAKGVIEYLCLRCKSHCIRCDIELTDETKVKSPQPCEGRCNSCKVELAALTKGNAGFKQRDYNLNRNFGITVPEYDAILEAQGGGCWICSKTPLQGQRRLAVDHLHSKGEKKRNPRERRGRIRGLLCGQCNRALGKFKDNIEHLRKAACYLETWPAQKILNKEDK